MSDYGYIPQLLELHISQATGVDIIDLLHGSDGVFLDSWEPAENEDKGGGVFENSPMHEGQNLIHSVIGNADEGFNLTIRGYDADYCWQIKNKIQFALDQARAYSKRNRGSRPVYLAMQVPRLKGGLIQYALLTTGITWALGQPFRSQSPYHQFMSALHVAMAVNREAWQDVAPGSSTAIARGQTNTFDDVVYGDATFAGVKDYSDTRKVFITNKRQQNNITQQHSNSGASWASIGASVPYTLSMGAVDDAIYLGIENLTGFGPFDNLVFDIGTPASSTTSYALAYEYYTGATWASVANQVDNTNQLSTTGVNSLHWSRASNWASVNLNSLFGGSAPNVTGYWIRIRLASLTGIFTPATQQNRKIYTAVNPFIEVESDSVQSDGLALLARLKLTKYVELGGEPFQMSNVTIGLKSFEDDTDSFVSYINLADVQNPSGVTIAAGTHSALADSATAPSRRAIVYTPSGATDTWAVRAFATIGNAIASDYVGRYHAFLRVTKSSATGTMSLRAKAFTSVIGDPFFTGSQVNLTQTAAFTVVDLGTLNLKSLAFDGSYSDIVIGIDVKTSNNTPTLTMFDLIIIPADEWIGSFVISDTGDSSLYLASYFDLDSTSDLRNKSVNSYVRRVSGDNISALLNGSANGRMILQPNKRQQYHFFIFDQTTGASNIAATINAELSAVKRWRGVRST